jgi:hypothetical protein
VRQSYLDHHALDAAGQPGHQLFPKIAYGLYEVTAAPDGNWAKASDRFILADRLAPAVSRPQKSKPMAIDASPA